MKRNLGETTPPPPPPPTKSKTSATKKAALIAVPLILVVVVASLFAFDIIPWRARGPSGNVNYGILMGRISDTFGNPIADVNITAANVNALSNAQGWFSISNIPAGDRIVARFSKTGYVTAFQLAKVQIGKSSFVEVTMSLIGFTDTFSGSSGGTASTSDGGSLTVGANSLVDPDNNLFTGTAYASLTTFDPSDESEADAFPGQFRGVTPQNDNAPIKSFGFMDMSIVSQSGDPLQLASGSNGTITVPVPLSMRIEAQNLGTCPMWYFDTSTGSWRIEGVGTYDAISGTFVGNISHFSTWNFDYLYQSAFISGRVIDSNGTAVQGAQVKCWTDGWYQVMWESGETSTGADGKFKRIPVEAGVLFNYRARKSGYQSEILQILRILAVGEEYDVGDIVLDAPVAQTTLTWGENPRDLDSHLAARLAGNVSFHIYYSQLGSIDSDPYADLDTDDTSGFGPEVVSISRLRQGTYRYSVRHYAGDGNISTSGAEVNAVIPDVGIFRFRPPTTQPAGTDIWRVFDMVVDSNGRVTAVNPINDYVTGADESSLLFP